METLQLLGLAHVAFWTPLVAYLARQRPRLEPGSAVRRWVTILLVTNAVSLVVDDTDGVRYPYPLAAWAWQLDRLAPELL